MYSGLFWRVSSKIAMHVNNDESSNPIPNPINPRMTELSIEHLSDDKSHNNPEKKNMNAMIISEIYTAIKYLFGDIICVNYI